MSNVSKVLNEMVEAHTSNDDVTDKLPAWIEQLSSADECRITLLKLGDVMNDFGALRINASSALLKVSEILRAVQPLL